MHGKNNAIIPTHAFEAWTKPLPLPLPVTHYVQLQSLSNKSLHIIIIIIIIAFMQAINNYTPETNRISTVYSVAVVLYLHFVLHVMLFRL